MALFNKPFGQPFGSQTMSAGANMGEQMAEAPDRSQWLQSLMPNRQMGPTNLGEVYAMDPKDRNAFLEPYNSMYAQYTTTAGNRPMRKNTFISQMMAPNPGVLTIDDLNAMTNWQNMTPDQLRAHPLFEGLQAIQGLETE